MTPLSPREKELYDLAYEGKDTREVAAAMGLAYQTALTYIKRILPKLGHHSMARALLARAKGEIADLRAENTALRARIRELEGKKRPHMRFDAPTNSATALGHE